MRGNAPTQLHSSRPPSVHGHWGQPCAGSNASGPSPPCALAAASSAAESVEKVVDGARSSPPTPPITVLLAARSMVALMGRLYIGLGWQVTMLMAETRLWREADQRRERESGRSEGEGQTRKSYQGPLARWGCRAGWRGQWIATHRCSRKKCRSGRPHANLRYLRSAGCAAPRTGESATQREW